MLSFCKSEPQYAYKRYVYKKKKNMYSFRTFSELVLILHQLCGTIDVISKGGSISKPSFYRQIHVRVTKTPKFYKIWSIDYLQLKLWQICSYDEGIFDKKKNYQSLLSFFFLLSASSKSMIGSFILCVSVVHANFKSIPLVEVSNQ